MKEKNNLSCLKRISVCTAAAAILLGGVACTDSRPPDESSQVITTAVQLQTASGSPVTTSEPDTTPVIPITQPEDSSAAETESVTEPETEPVAQPETEPVTEPVTVPSTEPVTVPVTTPITVPVTTPITAPVTTPITVPVTTPVTAPVTTGGPVTPPAPTVTFLPTGGYFIYGNSAYVTASYNSSQADVAAKYKAVAEKYGELFPGARVSVLIAPTSSVMLSGDEYVMTKTANQKEILDKLTELYASSTVNFVNIAPTLLAHSDEYLFLKTDHHWNSLGAYYAYSDFMKSIGMTPSPIEAFDKSYVRANYLGSIYNYNSDSSKAQVMKNFKDTIESYESKKPCVMKIYNDNGSLYGKYDMSIFNTVGHNGGIASFAGGDRPLVHINVPENPQDLSILIIKDSYADQLAPFFVENYGNIYIVDPRYNSTKKLVEKFAAEGIDDILFVNNLQVANSNYWQSAYARLAGFSSP